MCKSSSHPTTGSPPRDPSSNSSEPRSKGGLDPGPRPAKRSTIREGGGKRLQAVVADGEKAKSEQRLRDKPLGSCRRNKGQVTYDVSIRTSARSLLQVLGLPKTPLNPQHTLVWSDLSPPQLLSSGLKDFRSDSAPVPAPLAPAPPRLEPPPSHPHPLSLQPVPHHPLRLSNSPSNPQPRLTSPADHLSLQAPTPHSAAVPRSESQPSHMTKSKNSPSRLYLSLPCCAGNV